MLARLSALLAIVGSVFGYGAKTMNLVQCFDSHAASSAIFKVDRVELTLTDREAVTGELSRQMNGLEISGADTVWIYGAEITDAGSEASHSANGGAADAAGPPDAIASGRPPCVAASAHVDLQRLSETGNKLDTDAAGPSNELVLASERTDDGDAAAPHPWTLTALQKSPTELKFTLQGGHRIAFYAGDAMRATGGGCDVERPWLVEASGRDVTVIAHLDAPLEKNTAVFEALSDNEVTCVAGHLAHGATTRFNLDRFRQYTWTADTRERSSFRVCRAPGADTDGGVEVESLVAADDGLALALSWRRVDWTELGQREYRCTEAIDKAAALLKGP